MSTGKWEGEVKTQHWLGFVLFYKVLVPIWQTALFQKHVYTFQCNVQTSPFETASLMLVQDLPNNTVGDNTSLVYCVKL